MVENSPLPFPERAFYGCLRSAPNVGLIYWSRNYSAVPLLAYLRVTIVTHSIVLFGINLTSTSPVNSIHVQSQITMLKKSIAEEMPRGHPVLEDIPTSEVN
ncbi:hypothetical protein Celaphus_00019552 [Cervus elaphus hippelaphus]|uniref:Uncharacterized protein n=1 Tax=Cervus elaphus hippelaphus TaxID=46360 RepID=A0A212C3L7_CEREH|nr:hypothetical protein Celaphus_00019552 [Cervus elaphus hippelaphus]